jgi:hypothetical protein|tara:strand:+ start:62 stop:394 length:333 start_codon:yes stop_codon:yes gene_type:complete
MAYKGDGSVLAWIHFNGNNAAIQQSYNISSISRYSTGMYQLNFTTTCANSSYCVNINKRLSDSGTTSADKVFCSVINAAKTTSLVRVFTRSDAGSLIDCDEVYVVIVGDN